MIAGGDDLTGCSEPCIPSDEELQARHPSCVFTECGVENGTATCVVTGLQTCDPNAGISSLSNAPNASSGSDTPPCDPQLVVTCCQGGVLGQCTDDGECGVQPDAEECTVPETLEISSAVLGVVGAGWFSVLVALKVLI